MKTLTIRLIAPLQSYGNQVTFERRTSDDHPSKSAIIGMIAAAMGYKRDDKRIIQLNELSFAVRVDQRGTTLTDFQMAHSKKGDKWVTHRDYLQDAVFVVALGSDDENLISDIELALRRPKFQLFLGRRANVPAGVINPHIFENTDPVSVLSKLEWQASRWYQQRYWHRENKRFVNSLELIADADLLPDKRSFVVKDRVISFDQRNRQHGYRPVASDNVDHIKLNQKYIQRNHHEKSETVHDAFGAL
ncbi:type I-E CRISPR-associated protein Cas5/CasD [Lentilactobacillus parabuchneri]|uniref:type I-E CRISPR-associated protein Cas5/CasD n=1 Tax=Lentilactobacillus parabuchneri TaxID=152331 RepID=UPI0018679544|nr:type I-E CRISPR-associated protein Cas5/CasD [Lentilactobacillus parabuchneri]QOP50335.1 type I-E CRISPR-associated protein Cas5/CasD [Lentilactobacillus parabuchneri]